MKVGIVLISLRIIKPDYVYFSMHSKCRELRLLFKQMLWKKLVKTRGSKVKNFDSDLDSATY